MVPIHFQEKLQEFYANKFASIFYLPIEKIAVCTATAPYIPMKDFQQLFEKASQLIKEENIEKFIFDKRKLSVFHQPSMEWYHVVWKEQMFAYGLHKYRKLVPDDKVFEQSILTGKTLIKRKYPEFNFSKYDILYCQTLQEAFEV